MIDGITNCQKVMLYIGLLESKRRRLIWVYYSFSIYIFDKEHFCVLQNLCIGKIEIEIDWEIVSTYRLIDFHSLSLCRVLLPRIVIDS